MKRTLMILALVGAVMLSAAPVLADGDFYVIAGGGGGGVGTKITSLPYVITKPGFYYLDRDLTLPEGALGIAGIQINNGGSEFDAGAVTIDLMGFSLTGNGVGTSGINNPIGNVEVRNGTLRNWDVGISGSQDCRILNLRVEYCNRGMMLMHNAQIKGCTIVGKPNHGDWDEGIRCGGSSLVTGNTVRQAGIGIYADGTISGNSISSCRTGIMSASLDSTIIGNTITGWTKNALSLGNDSSSPTAMVYYLVAQNTVSMGIATPPDPPNMPLHTAPNAMVTKVDNAGLW